MKRFIAAIFCLFAMSAQVQAAILIKYPNGVYVAGPANMTAACAQTNPILLTAPVLASGFANISSATVHGCSAPITVDPGGGLSNTTTFRANGGFYAGDYQVAFGTGVLQIGSVTPIVKASWAGVKCDNSTDNSTTFPIALNMLSGTNDVYFNYYGNQYSGAPNQILQFPAGICKTSTGEWLINKNNARIWGMGSYNTTIKYTGTGTPVSVVKFVNASAGELSYIGIDGGLPFVPTMSETYGAIAGLKLDLAVRFKSHDLVIRNTRQIGILAIHLWQSWLYDTELSNGGWFADNSTQATRGAAILFSSYAPYKESSNALGSGFQSQETVFENPILGWTGSYYYEDAPVQNLKVVNPNAEGLDYTSFFTALNSDKYHINGASEDILIDGGKTYAHDHTFQSNATLFNITSSNPNIVVRGHKLYVPGINTYPEVTSALNLSSVFPVKFDLSINDYNGKLVTPITIGTGVSSQPAVGSIFYSYSGAAVKPDALFSGSSNLNFTGKVLTSGRTSNRDRYEVNYDSNQSSKSITWSPNPIGFTEVIGGGSITTSGTYSRSGKLVTVSATITPAGGATIAAVANTSVLTVLPVAAKAGQNYIGQWIDSSTGVTAGTVTVSGTSIVIVTAWGASSDSRQISVTYESQ